MRTRLILILPVSLAVLASLLFAAQGGFGGGHGPLDLTIWILGFPGTLATTFLPKWPGDFVALVAVPAVLNLALWFAASSLIQKRLKARRT